MPGARFNREHWPAEGPHRALLEVLDAVHVRRGMRSLRVIGRDMNLAYTQVHKIVRGVALPVDERQVRDLVRAVAGRCDVEDATRADDAVEHWFAAVASAAATSLGSGESTHPPDNASVPVTSTDDVRPRSSGRRALAVGATGIALAVGAAFVVALREVPSTQSSRGAPVAGEAVVLADDFETDEIDPVTWNGVERPDVVSARDGALHFVVDSDDTANGLHTQFAPRGTGPFTEVSFVAAVPHYDQAGPGGIALIVTEANGRNHRILFGPSSGGPETAVLFCDKAFCSQFDDYIPPAEFIPFDVGEHVPIRLVATGRRLHTYVRDRLVAQSPPVEGPLASLVFDVYGADHEAWEITIDDLSVTG